MTRFMTKKTLTIFTAVFFSFTALFTGCSNTSAKNNATSGKTQIMASFYPLYIMLMNITQGADVELSMLAPADTGCLHDYQLTTGDMKNLENADILVLNGAGMEDFAEKALEIKKKEQVIIASEGYPLFEDNPHIWVSLEGAEFQVNKIALGLADMDKANADLYMKNAEAYTYKIQTLREEMKNKLTPYAGKKIITFHEAFPYFAQEFNLEIAGVIEREPGTEPTALELKELISLIKEEQSINSQIYLFAEEQYSSSAGEIIASETGLKVYELDPEVSGEISGDAYLDGMKKNLQILEEAFAN